MADKKISALTASTTPLAGTEVLPIVQGGSTVKVSIANVTAGRAVAASSLTTTGNINTTGGILKVDASGLSSGLQVDGYAPGAAFNGFITNNDASAGTASRLSLGRSTASVFGFIQTNNNTEAVEVGTNSVVRLTASKTGDITANTGNLVIGTAGKGIDFSAATHAAGMTSELLNDYEEGTWTPTDGSGAGLSFSNVTNNCFYTRIGRMVVCVFGLSYPATASVSSAALLGLPFTSKSSASNVAGGYTTYTDAGIQIQLLVGNNDTSVTLWKNTGGSVTNVELSGKWLRGVITYFV
jgi:hypothetical protein